MIVSVALAVLSAHSHFAPTAAAAALRASYPAQTRAAKIVRVNVSGRFATVLARGAMMEGSPMNSAILVEHFPEGWQPLESLNFICRIYGHGLSTSGTSSLLAGMPLAQNDRPCKDAHGDSGSATDIEAIRAIAPGPLIPYVTVKGSYAKSVWYGAGGGEAVFRKSASTWKRIGGGGGAFGVADYRRLGVPASDMCAFHVFDAKCGPATAPRP